MEECVLIGSVFFRHSFNDLPEDVMVESTLAADSLQVGVDRMADLLRWYLHLGILPTRLLQNEDEDIWGELR